MSALRKDWIADDTVAAVRAGVWTALAHDISAAGALLIQNLLSVHTMVMFL